MREFSLYENPALFMSPIATNRLTVNFTEADGGKNSKGVPPYVFHEDGSVTFNVEMPGAKRVEVRLGRDKLLPLEKQADGLFSGTFSGLGVGSQHMGYLVDGVPTIYRKAPIGGGLSVGNCMEIPDPDETFYLYKDVPHGAVRYEFYDSSVTGALRGCIVYTPPSYDYSPDREYPTLYLQHGTGGGEMVWLWDRKINYIMDNLIAEGKAQEMLVVINNGYAINNYNRDKSLESYDGAAVASYLSDMLAKDCVPFMEQRFRVKKGKEWRAVAGYSMGAGHAWRTAKAHPDVFGSVGVLAGTMIKTAMPHPDWKQTGNPELERPYYQNPDNLNQFKLVFFCIGTEDYGYKNQLNDLAEVQSYPRWNEVKTFEFDTVKGEHGAPASRRAIVKFVCKLFKEESK